MRKTVSEAIRSLPEATRTVTTLFYVGGYTQGQIAEFLETPVTTVNNRLHSARARLRERMIGMVERELKRNALPRDFERKLLNLILLHAIRESASAISFVPEGEGIGVRFEAGGQWCGMSPPPTDACEELMRWVKCKAGIDPVASDGAGTLELEKDGRLTSFRVVVGPGDARRVLLTRTGAEG